MSVNVQPGRPGCIDVGECAPGPIQVAAKQRRFVRYGPTVITFVVSPEEARVRCHFNLGILGGSWNRECPRRARPRVIGCRSHRRCQPKKERAAMPKYLCLQRNLSGGEQ